MDPAENTPNPTSTGFDTTHRPSFSVEEVPAPAETPATHEPLPPVVPEVPVSEAAVVETVPQMPPQAPPVVSPTPTAPSLPQFNNVMAKPHPVRKLLFLIPAVLLVATIYFVARITGNNYTMREPAPTILPTAEPTATPTPTSTPPAVKTYKNEEMLVQFSIPDDFAVILEEPTSVSFGRSDTELFVVRTDEFTNYDEEDETSEYIVGGREAVMLNLTEEGSVPVKVVQTIDEPKYEFVMYPENAELEEELVAILDSVVFLVDTTNWKTFDNSTFNYQIKYPPEWSLAENTDEEGIHAAKSEISKDANNKTLNNLVIQTSSNLTNAALTASEIVSSTRTLSGWSNPPKIELRKLGGGDAQVIQGELTGKWRAYVVIWYKNTVIQMTWDDNVNKLEQQTFDNILASFEFTN